jgi:hypothetical protein
MHGRVSQIGHHRAESGEIFVRRVLKIDWDVDIRHAQPADAGSLIRQCFLVAMQSEIDDVTDPERMNIRQFLFGGLPGRCDPVIKSPPVIDGHRIGHEHHPGIIGSARSIVVTPVRLNSRNGVTFVEAFRVR